MSEYKEALRSLLQRKGRPVEFDQREVEDHPEWPEMHVSTYGWVDYKADNHCRPVEKWGGDGCSWVIEPGARVVERTYSQFTDTFHDNADEVGINVHPAHCVCGKYRDITLRYTASLGETIRELSDTSREGLTL